MYIVGIKTQPSFNQSEKTMLARIQTLYLFVTAALALGSMILPFWSFNATQLIYFSDFANTQASEARLVATSYAAGLFSVLTAFLSVVALFLYRNRMLQKTFVLLALLCSALDLFSGFAGAHLLNQCLLQTGLTPTHRPEAGMFLLLPEPVLVWLALGGINRDHKIANAYKRL